MDDPSAVRVPQRISDVDAVLDGFADSQRPLSQPRRQRLAVHVFHRDESSTRILTNFVHRADSRMIQRRCASRFPEQSLPWIWAVGIGMEHLDRQRPFERGVVGAEHRAHAAGAKRCVDPVAAQEAAGGERRVHSRGIRHRRARV